MLKYNYIITKIMNEYIKYTKIWNYIMEKYLDTRSQINLIKTCKDFSNLQITNITKISNIWRLDNETIKNYKNLKILDLTENTIISDVSFLINLQKLNVS